MNDHTCTMLGLVEFFLMISLVFVGAVSLPQGTHATPSGQQGRVAEPSGGDGPGETAKGDATRDTDSPSEGNRAIDPNPSGLNKLPGSVDEPVGSTSGDAAKGDQVATAYPPEEGSRTDANREPDGKGLPGNVDDPAGDAGGGAEKGDGDPERGEPKEGGVGEPKKRQLPGESEEPSESTSDRTGDLEDLKRKVTELRRKLHETDRTIDKYKGDIEYLNGEIKRLNVQITELRKLGEKQKHRIAELLTNSRKLEAKIGDLTDTVEQLRTKNAHLNGEIKRLNVQITELRKLSEKQKQLRTENAQLKRQIEILQRDATHKLDPALIGLRGPFTRVVFLVDASFSMRGSTGQEGERSWAYTHRVIETWLNRLELKDCALVIFNSGVQRFPMSRIKANKENRKRLIGFLASARPQGETNTPAALEAAYAYKPTSIIFFTDGRPELKGHTTEQMMNEVYRLCEDHPTIPVNCIAVSNYFDPKFSGFLLKIGKITGGTFIGR